MTNKERYEGTTHKNCQGLDFIVLQYFNWNSVQIQFIENGEKRLTQLGAIQNGGVKSREFHKQKWIGQIFNNISGLEYKILEKLDKETFKVKFLKTGTIRTASRKAVTDGKVKDEYSINVMDEGCYGRPDEYAFQIKEIKNKWYHMMTRCYSENEHNYAHQKAEVSDRWKCLEYFVEDFPKIEGYFDWTLDQSFELDKDKIGNGYLYSLETCCLISADENRRQKRDAYLL